MSLELDLELEPIGPAGVFVLTDEQVAEIGGGAKAFPVVVTVNGNTVRLRLARMGGKNLIGFSKANRAAAGVELGGRYSIVIDHDVAERTVEVPEDLRAALDADNVAAKAFEALSYSHRREYVTWVESAKKPDTRARRVEQTIERLQ